MTLSRVQSIVQHYGWRTPFVVWEIAKGRCGLRNTLRLNWLRLTTKGHKGRRILFGRDVSMTPGAWLDIGDGGYIGDRCIFEVSVNPQARVSVGEDVWISHDCHLASYGHVAIGNHVLIGEFVSIRDSTHSYADLAAPIKRQKDIVGSILIEDDVWLGRGCLIQGDPEGIVIGKGAIVAANSVVVNSIPAYQIWGGTPARLIKLRQDNG